MERRNFISVVADAGVSSAECRWIFVRVQNSLELPAPSRYGVEGRSSLRDRIERLLSAPNPHSEPLLVCAACAFAAPESRSLRRANPLEHFWGKYQGGCRCSCPGCVLASVVLLAADAIASSLRLARIAIGSEQLCVFTTDLRFLGVLDDVPRTPGAFGLSPARIRTPFAQQNKGALAGASVKSSNVAADTESKDGAEEGTRTPTILLPPAPQAGASANSATSAYEG